MCIRLQSFKSCPREGASCAHFHIERADLVSSHAPVRGHQAAAHSAADQERSFKSCPREGASVPAFAAVHQPDSFKSCPREGASSAAEPTPPEHEVSSHAPVRGHPSGGAQAAGG